MCGVEAPPGAFQIRRQTHRGHPYMYQILDLTNFTHVNELGDAVSLFSIMNTMALLRTNDFHRIHRTPFDVS